MMPAPMLQPVESPRYFDFDIIDGTARLQESYQLRYQVYCLEKEFLPQQDYPSQSESDRFDDHSIHLGGVNLTGDLVGTVRLVNASMLGFPCLEHCQLYEQYQTLFEQSAERLSHFAEISRLVVNPGYRRRANDGTYGLDCDPDQGKAAKNIQKKHGHHRVRPEIVLGLYKSMYQASKRNGITHWLVAMEKTLQRMLSRFEFNFTSIGPQVDYYGPVTPFMAAISDIEQQVLRSKPELFWEMMEGLEPEFLPSIAK